MGRGNQGLNPDSWPVGSSLPLRRPAGSGVDERIVHRVLAEFGLPSDGNPGEYAAAYRLFLPQASRGGVRLLLRDARRTAAGKIDPGTPEEQINWLAHELCVPAPDGRVIWWQKIWDRALKRAGLPQGPPQLSEQARLLLVRRLASEPSYPSQLVNALAEAIKFQVG